MTGGAAGSDRSLRVLVVDEMGQDREQVASLLREDPRVASVLTAAGSVQALRTLTVTPVDAVFSDTRMPGIDGVELARTLHHFAERPHVVFVSGHDDRAVDAFEVEALDWVPKPVRPERLAEAVRRVVLATTGVAGIEDETLAVELAGVTHFVRRSEIRYVEAQGDYARLHTAGGSHLVRVSLAELEQRWADAGFSRIHRSTLVALEHVGELCVSDGHCSVVVGAVELPVSRRHAHALREQLAACRSRL
jgi:DNA-binding LytR/AlgR family response regulator